MRSFALKRWIMQLKCDDAENSLFASSDCKRYFITYHRTHIELLLAIFPNKKLRSFLKKGPIPIALDAFEESLDEAIFTPDASEAPPSNWMTDTYAVLFREEADSLRSICDSALEDKNGFNLYKSISYIAPETHLDKLQIREWVRGCLGIAARKKDLSLFKLMLTEFKLPFADYSVMKLSGLNPLLVAILTDKKAAYSTALDTTRPLLAAQPVEVRKKYAAISLIVYLQLTSRELGLTTQNAFFLERVDTVIGYLLSLSPDFDLNVLESDTPDPETGAVGITQTVRQVVRNNTMRGADRIRAAIPEPESRATVTTVTENVSRPANDPPSLSLGPPAI